MFLSSAWHQLLQPGFTENQPLLARTLTLNLIIHPMSKKSSCSKPIQHSHYHVPWTAGPVQYNWHPFTHFAAQWVYSV